MGTAHRLGQTLVLTSLAVFTACNDPGDPNRDLHILGYTISGQADGTDPATGDALTCAFIINMETGGPLVGSWTDTTTVRVLRVRTGATQSVTYDTTMVAQQATITVADSSHFQFSVTGPFTENLSATMVPAYPGYVQGDWTCGPEHPLGRVQPDVTLPGRWNAQPVIDLPIG
jgi:hypothetical protein